MKNKILTFALLVQTQQEARHIASGTTNPDFIKNWSKTTVKEGKKFTKVDVGTSGKFMVENETGNIFGIKGYGVVHTGHFYGTVDTTAEYHWGNYYPEKLDGTVGAGRGSCPALTFAPEPSPVN
jgi:hypothetical protein